eukprot:gnl/TRDRNA2_/TRDRNA2_83387_c0_seq1.p1 gnl/TRDRNA2_/TRDRNA2_83387_c0~~gnl/TRDRNA2_/TRDRNA2_83387_c0_seq1.p1  ORF type:complete len:248 (+),score=37.34 gnl/TRDRNA2_/TRDRNA2_83387_c0_seq1:94-837(+)
MPRARERREREEEEAASEEEFFKDEFAQPTFPKTSAKWRKTPVPPDTLPASKRLGHSNEVIRNDTDEVVRAWTETLTGGTPKAGKAKRILVPGGKTKATRWLATKRHRVCVEYRYDPYTWDAVKKLCLKVRAPEEKETTGEVLVSKIIKRGKDCTTAEAPGFYRGPQPKDAAKYIDKDKLPREIPIKKWKSSQTHFKLQERNVLPPCIEYFVSYLCALTSFAIVVSGFGIWHSRRKVFDAQQAFIDT